MYIIYKKDIKFRFYSFYDNLFRKTKILKYVFYGMHAFVNMLHVHNQRWSEANASVTATNKQDVFFEPHLYETVSLLRCFKIERN